MKEYNVLIVNKSDNPIPTYEKEGDAGMDIRANLTDIGKLVRTNNLIRKEPTEFKDRLGLFIQAGETKLIPTGLYVALPLGTEFQVRSRSGLSLKYKITVTNNPGTVDAGYRGEVGVILTNLSKNNIFIEHGDRIAQLVLKEQPVCKWIQVDELPESVRGDGGFGSTGTK